MKLLVCVDLSESTGKIVKEAEVIAKGLSAKVWLLHIAEPDPYPVVVGGPTIRDSTSEKLHSEHMEIQEMADRLREVGLDTTALFIQGAIVDTILKEASKLDVDMIVVGSHGRGAMFQLVLGSVSEGVIHKSECPVHIVPTHERA
jgi:nucleotide-binding universal stress UspA family protein